MAITQGFHQHGFDEFHETYHLERGFSNLSIFPKSIIKVDTYFEILSNFSEQNQFGTLQLKNLGELLYHKQATQNFLSVDMLLSSLLFLQVPATNVLGAF